MQEWVEAALKPFAPKTTADIQTPEQLTEAIQVELKRKMLEYRRQLQGPLMGKSARYEHPSGVSFWVLLGDHTSSRIINSNRDDPATTFMLSKLTPGGVFLDIGANAGWFTMRAAHIYRQLGGGHVHCFEPQTALLELLNKSRVDNRLEDFITIHPVALGDQIASIFMAETSLSSGGSFVRLSGAPTSKAAQMVTLDSMDLPITRLDALKIDIEGA
jgi:FkbM family methyltransferase